MQKFTRVFGLLLIGVGLLTKTAFAQEEEVFPALIRVTMEPAAQLVVNHKVVSEGTAFQLRLPPNEPALIKVSAPGYETEYRMICPTEGERGHEAFKLKRLATPVLFRSNIPATILCDGQQLGTTPCHYFFRDPRAYRVIFRAQGYEDRVLRLNLESAQPQVVDMDLSSDAATLSVNSIPSGATLQINGISRGVTPCTIPRLKEGAHKIQLKMPGYRDYEEVVELSVAEHFTVTPRLQKLGASLVVKATPANTTVYVNGVAYGQSPITLNHLTEGVYALRFEHPGYESQVRSLYLKAGQTHTETCDLSRESGEMRFQTQPTVVEVLMDGKLLLKTEAKSAQSFTSKEMCEMVPVGEHVFTFRAEGYTTVKRTVNVKRSGNAPLRVRLEFEPNYEIKTATAVHRGAFVRKDLNGAITLELRPGFFRTFGPKEIIKTRILKAKNDSTNR